MSIIADWGMLSALRDFMLKHAGPLMDPYFHLLIHCILIVLYYGHMKDITGTTALQPFHPFHAIATNSKMKSTVSDFRWVAVIDEMNVNQFSGL